MTRRSLRPGSLMLEVPLENAGTQQLTASLNLQPGSRNALQFHRRPRRHSTRSCSAHASGRVLVSAGSGAEQLRLSGLDVLSTKETEGSKPVTFKDLSEAITMADVSRRRRRLHAVRRSMLPAGESTGGSTRARRTRAQRQGPRRKLGDSDHACETFGARAVARPCRMAVSQARAARRSATRWASRISFSSAHRASRASPSSPSCCSMSQRTGG